MYSRALGVFFFLANALCWGTCSQPVWPTPNPAFMQGKPLSDYIQPTVSGRVESGLFGSVRSEGARFHEGIDLKPIARNRKNEPTDAIFAAWEGTVVYINNSPGKSGYGRYIVLEHKNLTPAILTVYAHLSAIAPGIQVGTAVQAGQTIAVMGRSAMYSIAKQRAHLHFEMDLRLGNLDNFQRWYTKNQDIHDPNLHGAYNGMNLIAFDPLAVFMASKAGELTDLAAYLKGLPTAFTLHICTKNKPDFISRYPALVDGPLPKGPTAWEVEFTSYGLPKRWKAATALAGLAPGSAVLVNYTPKLIEAEKGRKTILIGKNGCFSLGKHLKSTLDIMFGEGICLISPQKKG